MRAFRLLALSGAGIACLAGGPEARANGRFPRADLVAFQPGDASKLVLRTTFGLLESRDGGLTFSYVCEAALGLGVEENPAIVVTAGGAQIAGRLDGAIVSRDGCEWTAIPELAGQTVTDLTLDRGVPGRVVGFGVRGLGADGYASQVVSSSEGSDWTAIGQPLRADLLPLSIEVAPSDSQRVYLSARLGTADEFASLLLRSDDGGASFVESAIPGTTGLRLAYIGAVDPRNADRAYLRVDDPDGTVVLATDDAGATFRTLFHGTGTLFGFALSPDGQELAVGGPGDGLWIGSADGDPGKSPTGDGAFERRADIGPSCLAWEDTFLYACADESAGFSLGRSEDEGRTFAPLLRFSALCGDTACSGETRVGRQCGAAWEAVAPQIGATCATGGAQAKPPVATSPGRSGGSRGGCVMGRGTPPPWFGSVIAWVALAVGARRRSNGRQSSPSGRYRAQLARRLLGKPDLVVGAHDDVVRGRSRERE
jgi:hypothetical protein